MRKKKRKNSGIEIDDLIKENLKMEIEDSIDNEIVRENEQLKSELSKIKEIFDFIDLSEDELFSIALDYDDKKDYPMAIFYYMVLLKKNPDHIKAMINLGILYYEFDINERAIEMFEKVLEIDPNNTIARENLDLLKQK